MSLSYPNKTGSQKRDAHARLCHAKSNMGSQSTAIISVSVWLVRDCTASHYIVNHRQSFNEPKS